MTENIYLNCNLSNTCTFWCECQSHDALRRESGLNQEPTSPFSFKKNFAAEATDTSSGIYYYCKEVLDRPR